MSYKYNILGVHCTEYFNTIHSGDISLIYEHIWQLRYHECAILVPNKFNLNLI